MNGTSWVGEVRAGGKKPRPFSGEALEDALAAAFFLAAPDIAAGRVVTVGPIQCRCERCGGSGRLRKNVKGSTENVRCPACKTAGQIQAIGAFTVGG